MAIVSLSPIQTILKIQTSGICLCAMWHRKGKNVDKQKEFRFKFQNGVMTSRRSEVAPVIPVHVNVEPFTDFTHRLMPHQIETVIKLQRAFQDKERGKILADKMGLGKSATVVSSMALISRQHESSKFIIVCPKTMISTWYLELSKWVHLRLPFTDNALTWIAATFSILLILSNENVGKLIRHLQS